MPTRWRVLLPLVYTRPPSGTLAGASGTARSVDTGGRARLTRNR